jgi:hypothetical protein
MLATLSRKLGGYPFGSAVDYLLDSEGCPAFLISHLAEHTKNLEQDSRCSLLVHEPADDLQIRGRATLVGNGRRFDPAPALVERYLRYFPQARKILALPGFCFYRIEPLQVRYIADMGKVYWVDREDYLPAACPLESGEATTLAAVEREFSQAFRACCREFYGLTPMEVTLLGLDCDGFDLRADDRVLRFHFDRPVANLQSARTSLGALAKECLR